MIPGALVYLLFINPDPAPWPEPALSERAKTRMNERAETIERDKNGAQQPEEGKVGQPEWVPLLTRLLIPGNQSKKEDNENEIWATTLAIEGAKDSSLVEWRCWIEYAEFHKERNGIARPRGEELELLDHKGEGRGGINEMKCWSLISL